MFGLHDFWIVSAFVLCILSAVLCVVYGIVYWNKGADSESKEIAEGKQWTENEKEIEDKL